MDLVGSNLAMVPCGAFEQWAGPAHRPRNLLRGHVDHCAWGTAYGGRAANSGGGLLALEYRYVTSTAFGYIQDDAHFHFFKPFSQVVVLKLPL